MNTTALEASVAKLAQRISNLADQPSLSLDKVANVLTAAAEFLRASKPPKLSCFPLESPSSELSNHQIAGLVNRTVQLVVVQSEDVSLVLSPTVWSWNAGLGKLTLVTDYRFPEDCTVDIYYLE